MVLNQCVSMRTALMEEDREHNPHSYEMERD